MKFYDSDPFAQSKELLEQKQSDARLNQKLEKLFTPKPFSQRWKLTNRAGIVLSYLCNILSGLTAFTIISFLIFSATQPTLGTATSIVASTILSSLVVATTEAIKRQSLNNFLRNIIQFGRFSAALFCLVLLACSISILTSFYGAKQIPQAIQTTLQNSKPDTAKIAENYNAQIAALKKEKETYFENNKKRNDFGGYRLSSRYMGTYNEMIADISKLQESKTKALTKTTSDHTITQRKKEEDTHDLGWFLAYFALVVEFIFICLMLGNWLYYWNCYKERFSSQPKPTQKTGEAKGGNTKDENRQRTKDENRHRNRTCENCGKSYVHKHHKQKYCTDDCRKEAWKGKTKNESQERRKKEK